MSNQQRGVRTQNPRDFTVQIRVAGTEEIIGTGIAVSLDGKIITCAHVVEAALGKSPREAGEAEIGVYFPRVHGRKRKDYVATVAAYFERYDDDIVLLQLKDDSAPLAPELVPLLGIAEESEGNPFRSYGFRRLDHYIAGWADGKIQGCVDCPPDRNFQAEPVQLESSQINNGMSGAAVLDTNRDHVVGIVSETWFPDITTKDRDTAWAVNARVLSLEPLGVELHDEPHPKQAAPVPKIDLDEARAQVAVGLEPKWNNAPPPLEEWVGRVGLLKDISSDWENPDCPVTGLIGFGGEGKSSLARQWLDEFLADESQTQPDGMFWWGFYTRPSVDEFLEATLEYLSGGKMDPSKFKSASSKAQAVGAMLGAGKYLFVLDGMEILQHQEGDQYGLLRSEALRELLEYFGRPDHGSFCLITSRAQVLDLIDYDTYTQRDVMRMSPDDGRNLLKRLGVKGSDEDLDKAVMDWDGHALTLGLIGSYLADLYDGDIKKIDEIPPPVVDEPRYERVHRVLRRYDEHLEKAERAFMTLFSAFRTPVEEKAFDKVFQTKTEKTALNAPVAALGNSEFVEMVMRLMRYRMLRYDDREKHYTSHPLIRAHYFTKLTEGDRAQTQDAHEQIKDYYLDIAGDVRRHPTLEDLKPLIEVVYHLCQAGVYDEAFRVLQARIYLSDMRVIAWELGAYETALAIVKEFFPGGDTSKDPMIVDPRAKSWILNEMGLCLMILGRLSEAVSFFERANEIKLKITEDWINASIGYRNITELLAYLGALDASAEAAQEALILARQAEHKMGECKTLVFTAMIAHLQGDLKAASSLFQQAEELEQEIDPDKRYLYSSRGFYHADHMRRVGDKEYARRITEANSEICERNRWVDHLSICCQILGDLDADAGENDSASEHYDDALKIARSITYRPALIGALLARGRWLGKGIKDSKGAFGDLKEALGYATESGFQIYEADIRIALAWAYLADDNKKKAREEAEVALRMSEEMGYYWGKVDGEEVRKLIS